MSSPGEKYGTITSKGNVPKQEPNTLSSSASQALSLRCIASSPYKLVGLCDSGDIPELALTWFSKSVARRVPALGVAMALLLLVAAVGETAVMEGSVAEERRRRGRRVRSESCLDIADVIWRAPE